MPESEKLTASNIPQKYSGDEAAVLLVLQQLLDFVTHRDATKIAHTYLPDGGTARWRPTGMVCGPIGELVTGTSKISAKAEEYMWDPEFRFWGNMCMVWVSCRVSIEGMEPYYAKNNVSFHKVEGVWKITGIMDTIEVPE